MHHGLVAALWIALHVWGQPACGTPAVEWQDMGPLDYGGSVAADCRLLLNSRRRDALANWPTLCTTVVHEWGHLTGHGHSTDRRNVMYPVATRYYWRCTTKRGRFGF